MPATEDNYRMCSLTEYYYRICSLISTECVLSQCKEMSCHWGYNNAPKVAWEGNTKVAKP